MIEAGFGQWPGDNLNNLGQIQVVKCFYEWVFSKLLIA